MPLRFGPLRRELQGLAADLAAVQDRAPEAVAAVREVETAAAAAGATLQNLDGQAGVIASSAKSAAAEIEDAASRASNSLANADGQAGVLRSTSAETADQVERDAARASEAFDGAAGTVATTGAQVKRVVQETEQAVEASKQRIFRTQEEVRRAAEESMQDLLEALRAGEAGISDILDALSDKSQGVGVAMQEWIESSSEGLGKIDEAWQKVRDKIASGGSEASSFFDQLRVQSVNLAEGITRLIEAILNGTASLEDLENAIRAAEDILGRHSDVTQLLYEARDALQEGRW